ncbi:MAG: tRNA (N(6)-L-threonylcarbamoyladenosine(37)-C(2))-methylthiotransferase MtaB [bacterium]|nr:tRNA (N(6)-L-threonylcarbamoyladenosine(37)-C(2))-methylthiotransferase MtaB [bacterium]
MKTVAFRTLGCKLNQYETQIIRQMLIEANFSVVSFDSPADLYIINTCTVTNRSDCKSRQAIRQAVRRTQDPKVIVTGCYAQTNSKEISQIPGVGLVIGNSEKWRILEYLNSAGLKIGNISDQSEFETPEISDFGGNTRALIKVQDGCNSQCSYCKVPFARGPSRSQSLSRIIAQAERAVEKGYQEIVLTGVHLGRYGEELKEKAGLVGLLKALMKVEKLPRIRLSSIEPTEISETLINLLKEKKICSHLHIPLQSGSDRILERMGRGYTASFYRELVLKLDDSIPGIAIGCDVMVGFPGETEEDFNHTLKLIEKLPVAYLHVFEYSARPGTLAATFKPEVPPQEKKKRSEILRRLSAEKSFLFRKGFEGKTLSVLILNTLDKETGCLRGLSDNYIEVLLPGEGQWVNRFVEVKITEVTLERTLGELVNK